MHDDRELQECPKCDKCSAPITTGLMATMCPHARACALVHDDEHFAVIEELREDLGIERAAMGGDAK